ncbi:MAG: hypothetical protein U0R69_00385 [Gaiellales bacterium]
MSSGDASRIDEVFAPTQPNQGETGFQWYSISVEGAGGGAPNVDTVLDRKELAPYFSARFDHGEHLRLLILDARVQGDSPSGVGGAIFVARAADDLPGGSGREWLSHGKYALNCRSSTLYVLSLATDTRVPVSTFDPSSAPCPLPDGWRTDGSPVACTP